MMKKASVKELKMEFKASTNLAEQVYIHLSEKIIQFEIAPGERILEVKLAEELGVSRGPIREALRMLAKCRLLELIPRRGAKVAEITEQTIEWLFEVLVELYIILVRR